MEPFLGQIQTFGFNFAPRGWALCNGQLLSISQNTALFSLLGTTYGGDGRTTFGLPDLRGRAPVHFGQGPGLPNTSVGSRDGANTHSLSVAEMASHNHGFSADCNNGAGTTDNPEAAFPSVSNEDVYADSMNAKMGAMGTDNTGGNQSFNILGPRLTITICIALVGIFPSRN